MGLRSKWLRSKMIKSRAVNDRELLQDLMRATAQGQALFKAACPEIVSLEGLAVTTQFSKEAENELDTEEIAGIGDRKCYRCQKPGHIAKDCRQKKKEGTEKKDGNCNYCGKSGHWVRECFKKKREMANGTVKKYDKTKKEEKGGQGGQKRGGRIKTTGSGDEEDEEGRQLALDYEDEGEGVSRLRGRNRRESEDRTDYRLDFRRRSARQWH